MSLQSLFDSYPATNLPDHDSIAGYISDTDSLLANYGYSDTEDSGDTREGSRIGGQDFSLPIVYTRYEDNRTQEISTSDAVLHNAYQGLASDDLNLTHARIERFLSQFPTSLSDPESHRGFPDDLLPYESRLIESIENLKRKREETKGKLRSIRARVEYHELVYAQAMLGIDGDGSMVSNDMFDEEHQQRYLDEREMYYDDADTDPSHVPGLVDLNDAIPATAGAVLQENDSQDGENKKVDKGKGKAVDKGKGKARDKGKGRVRVSPYGLISSRMHYEGDEQIPRLGMGGFGRTDRLSRILDRSMPFDHLYEGRNEFTHHSSVSHMEPYGYRGMSVARSSGYNGMPIASGSGTHRDD